MTGETDIQQPTEETKEKRRQYYRKYHASHPGYNAAKQKEWRLKNPERFKLSQKRWRDNNPGYSTKYTRKWREENWERAKEIQDKFNAKHTAMRRNASILKRKHSHLNLAYIEKEVAHHLARGRNLGQIVVWLEMPASIISPIVKKLQTHD